MTKGYGDLGCTGNPIIKTPNLDDFYTNAIRLTNFHVSPTCSPTRGALLSGQYTNRAGSWHTINGRQFLHRNKKTIPELLQKSGYKTSLFGKWHLGSNYPFRPTDRGFQHVLYHKAGGVGQIMDYFGNDYFDDTYFLNEKPKKFKGYCTDIWFDEAIKWIEKNKSNKQPFFTMISTNAPHSPYIVAPKYRQIYEKYDIYDKHSKDKVKDFYGMITNIDENFGKLRKKLDELQLTDNTILIFMTDNGTSAASTIYNAGMRGRKNSSYDGGHRVPFFIQWKNGNLVGGKDINQLTAHIDIMPTLLSIAKVPFPKNYKIDGKDLSPLFKNQPWKERVIITDTQRVYNPIKRTRGSYNDFQMALPH